eukprot:jgi/Psemu1/292771/fgenesh1_pg.1302_\
MTGLAVRWQLAYVRLWLFVFVFVFAPAADVVVVEALPDGFIVETVTSKARGTTGVFVPHPAGNGNPPILLMVDKKGIVTALEHPDDDNDNDDAKVILDLSDTICTNGERGLQSIAAHPRFEENRFVYLFYTKKIDENNNDGGCPLSTTGGTWNVVDRLTMDPVTLELKLDHDDDDDDDEGDGGTRTTEIWRTSRLSSDVHNGGAMAFGSDGKLYVTTGDSGKKASAQPLDNVLGSIVRLNDDGSVPDDNPYTTLGHNNAYRCADTEGRVPPGAEGTGVCAEVFARGLRNPFRIRMDPNANANANANANNVPNNVRFTVSDVGGAFWEELSMGGTDYAAANYGWPEKEGPCPRDTVENCSLDGNENESDGSHYVEPYHYYQHRTMKEGGCVAGSAFVPPGLWPPEYKFLFIDFIFLEIYNLVEDPERECRSCTPPISGYRNETFYRSIQKEGKHVNNARMVDMFFGPYKDTQALYVFRFGSYDNLLRIRYNGIVDNAPPVAGFDFEVGLGLDYDWDFGDGSTSEGDPDPLHAFRDRGEYDVVLRVTDTVGQTQQATERIVVGTPPTATIVSPRPRPRDEDGGATKTSTATFFVGEVLVLTGEAFDHNGVRLNDTQLTWEVRKHHADHFHPFLDSTQGNNIELFPAPEPEDFFASTNSYLRIILTATDGDGVTTAVDRVVRPSLVTVAVETDPAGEGLAVLVDGYSLTTPGSVVSWENHALRLTASDQGLYEFSSWSDDGSTSTERERTIRLHTNTDTDTVAVNSNSNSNATLVVRARFCRKNGAGCSDRNHGECCGGLCVAETCTPWIGTAEDLEQLLSTESSPLTEPSPSLSPSSPLQSSSLWDAWMAASPSPPATLPPRFRMPMDRDGGDGGGGRRRRRNSRRVSSSSETVRVEAYRAEASSSASTSGSAGAGACRGWFGVRPVAAAVATAIAVSVLTV